MSEQPSTPRRSVALAAAALIISVAAFAAAFYLYDGMALVESMLAGELFSPKPAVKPVVNTPEPASTEPTLTLPPGVTEDFALGMWRDQVGTQETILDLIEGDIESLRIVSVEQKGDESVLNAVVRYEDGASAAGIIVMQRYGGSWYVAFTEASLADPGPIRPTGPLPDIADVDVPLLNTMLAEQYKSRDVTGDFADGKVRQVDVTRITKGPDTATIELQLVEDQGTFPAKVIAIRSDVRGRSIWLLAKFTKLQERD